MEDVESQTNGLPVEVVASSRREHSDVTFEELTPVTKDYTVEDLQGDHGDLQAEGDVIQAIEGSSLDLQGSARNILIPELPVDKAAAFENEIPAPMDPSDSRSPYIRSNGLRELTALLMTANLNREKEHKGLDGATRGTAADRMADTAEMLFKSKGELPDGIHIDSNGQPKTGNPASNVVSEAQAQTKRNAIKRMRIARQHVKENRELFTDFLKPRKKYIGHYWWIRFKYAILPGLGVAALLFYILDNPPHGRLVKVDGKYVDEKFGSVPDTASVSWWFLFIAVRQVVTFSSAKMWEMFLVDFLAVKTPILTALVGPYVTLWIAQSKGWPFRAMAWGIANLLFLQGPGRFGRQWAYWQDWIDLFNGSNASGNVLENAIYRSLIMCCIGFGGATAVKRIVLSNVTGKRLVSKYIYKQCSLSA
jgi:hypothetical protein